VCAKGQLSSSAKSQDGMAVDDLIEQFPITREQIRAVLEFAARSLEVPVPAR
jgi:uncharacterized protein (DUF433 family)